MPISSYAYTELIEGTDRGQISDEGSGVTRVFKIAWADLAGFMRALLGGWTDLGNNTLQYTDPDRYHEPFDYLVCRSAEFEPIGAPAGGEGTGEWTYARVIARYADSEEDYEKREIFTEDWDLGAELITINGSQYEVSGSGEPIENPAIQKIIVCGSYSLTVHATPTLPGGSRALIESLFGKINESTLRGAAAGTLLYMGARISTSKTLGGVNAFRIEHKWSYRSVGWNKVWDNKSGAWVTVVHKVSGAFIYEDDDGAFTQLIPNPERAPFGKLE